MLFRLLLSEAGFIVGIIIESILAVSAIVLLILVLKYGLPKFEEREPKRKKERAQPETYEVSYVSGGALGNPPETERYRKGEKVKIKGNMFAAPIGKQFNGWNDGESKYAVGSKMSMPARDVTLTAEWVEIPAEEPEAKESKYKLRYNSGGATGEVPEVEEYVQGDKVIIKNNMFAVPTGKQFDGWFDGVHKYSSGTKFSMPDQDLTLTAQWVEMAKAEVVKESKQAEKEASEHEGEVMTVEGGTTADGRPIIVNVYNTQQDKDKTVEKEVIHTVEKEEIDNEGLEFADYTILQLYDMLSEEQRKYFDTLKDAAMSKPEAKLMPGRSFFNIKIGKRSILKLRIRRMVTVGEYSLENDILKDFRKASDNKEGNAKIKVRPTLVAVTDEATLKTALNMIDLVYKQILES